VDLHTQGFDVIGSVCTASEVREIKLDLIPTFVESHGHGTDEWLDTCSGLVIGGSEAATNVLVVKDLYFKGEVLLEILYDHHEEGQLDAQSFLWVGWCCDVVGGYIGSHDLNDARLDIGVGHTLDVTIANLLLPNL